MRRRSVLLLLALLASPSPGAAAPAAYRIVVHPDNPVRQLERDQCSRLFLKKVTRWQDGRTVMPVDLPESSAVREQFSLDVHRRSTRSVKAYWQQMIFSGRAAPPPEVNGDEAVLAYVRENPTAIGYVSRDTSLSGVAVVTLAAADDEQPQRAAPPPRRQASRARRGHR